MKRILAAAVLTLALASPALSLPQVLNFQGRLTETGSAAAGQRDMTFTIYDSKTGGIALFTEARMGADSVAVSTGIFNVIIGELTPGGIPVGVFDGHDRYIEVRVGNSSLPRQRITSVAHAFFAAKAESLSSGAQLHITTITATSATVTGDVRITGQLAVGEGTIHLAAAAGGLVNGITFTQVGAQPLPQIRTAATGSQGAAAATGALPLSINAGLSGNLNLNPISSGGVLMSQNAVSNVGIGTLAPNSKLHIVAPLGTAGDILIVSTGASNMFRVLGNGDAIATRFIGDGSALTNVAASDATKVAKTGDVMVGSLSMSNSSITMTGPLGSIVSAASITASGFFGDATGLTALAPIANNQLATKAYVDAAIGTVGGAAPNFVAFSVPGTTSWTVPPNVTKILIEVWGAGGGGTDTRTVFPVIPGSGGGGGGYGKGQIAVTPGAILSITVGAGGSSGLNVSESGGNSSAALGPTILISAEGGRGRDNSQISGRGGNAAAPFVFPGEDGYVPSHVVRCDLDISSDGGAKGGRGGSAYSNPFGGGREGYSGKAPGGGGGGGACGHFGPTNGGTGGSGMVAIWF